MTIPFSDDSLLPRPAPKMPVSPHGEQYTVRSERAAWEKRATVVAEVAEELDSAVVRLTSTRWTNHFGDCAEGIAVYERATSAVASLANSLSSLSDSASELARLSRRAGESFEASDTASARDIEL